MSRQNGLYNAEDRILDRFLQGITDDVLPFTLLVNEEMETSHIFGDTKDYLSYPSGKLVNSLTKIVKKDLSIPIATGIQKAFKGNEEILLTKISVRDQNGLRTFQLHFKPFPGKRSQEKLLAVMIKETVESAHSPET